MSIKLTLVSVAVLACALLGCGSDGGGVLLLLGQNQADKTLEELNGGGGTTGTTPVGGTVECDRGSLTTAEENFNPSFKTLNDWKCDQGWALPFITAVDGDDTDSYDTIGVYVAEGQFWIPAPEGFCGTIDPDAPTTVPDDAAIPASLYDAACLTN